MDGDLLDAELNAMARDYYDANACGDCGQLRGQGCDCPDGLVPGGEHLAPIALPTGATWVAASYVLDRPVPISEPYPHIHDRTATGQVTGRTYQIWRRDCAACDEPNQRGNR